MLQDVKKVNKNDKKCGKNAEKCRNMLKNGFDRFKSDHFGFALYKNTLRIHF